MRERREGGRHVTGGRALLAEDSECKDTDRGGTESRVWEDTAGDQPVCQERVEGGAGGWVVRGQIMQDPVDYPRMLASPLGGATGELGQRDDTICLIFSSSSWVPWSGGQIQVGRGESERPGRRLS